MTEQEIQQIVTQTVLQTAAVLDRRQSWKKVIPAMFTSWTGSGAFANISATDIAELETEFQKQGAIFSADLSSIQLPNPVAGVGNGLYSSLLQPHCSIDELYAADEVMIKSLYITVIDTTVSGGTNQDSTTFTANTNSLTTDRAYNQNSFRNTELPFFMPNGLRPVIKVNGSTVFGANLKSTSVTSNGLTHNVRRMVGIPNPYVSDNLNLYLGKIENAGGIEIDAWSGQKISTNIQRYAVYCFIEFLIR